MSIEREYLRAPLTLNNEEIERVHAFANVLDRMGHSGMARVWVNMDPSICPTVHVVLVAGLAAIEQGLMDTLDLA
jgi:hypothetical protein